MAVVTIDGVFMGANIKNSMFDGKEKSALYVDVYQPESQDNDKTIQVKSDDIGLIQKFSKDFTMGSIFKCKASVNAYKNKAYYKLVELQ